MGKSPAKNRTTRIEVAGELPRDATADWIDLPRTHWNDGNIVQSQAVDQTQVDLRDPLSMVSWELPEGWVQRPSDRNLLRAEGPPIQRQSERGKPVSWSRLRLANRAETSSCQTFLALNLTGKSLNSRPRIDAKARIVLEVDPKRITPLRLLIQPKWTEVALSLPNSGRILDASQFRRSSKKGAQPRETTIWPEAEDIDNGELLIDITGNRAIDEVDGRTAVPPTWLARVKDVCGTFTAAVVPPTELNWSGQAAMQPDRISADELNQRELDFYGNIPDETLLFRPELGMTSPLFLEPPDVSFDVRSSLNFYRDGADIIETLTIEARQASQRISKKLSIVTGQSSSLPEYRWSLRGSDDPVPINLPVTVVTVDSAQGLYAINLGKRNLRGKRLVGHRQYTLQGNAMSVRLPTVLEATSQNAEVLLGAGLALKSRSASVALVPLESPAAAAPGLVSTKRSTATTRLRYDPANQPHIEVAAAEQENSVGIVWQQDISITASSRGSDSIWALITVSSAKPIEIDYDPDLHLAALSLNDQSIDIAAVPQRPIRLASAAGINTVRLHWNRNHLKSSWFRQCKIPRIEVAGVRVKSSYH